MVGTHPIFRSRFGRARDAKVTAYDDRRSMILLGIGRPDRAPHPRLGVLLLRRVPPRSCGGAFATSDSPD